MDKLVGHILTVGWISYESFPTITINYLTIDTVDYTSALTHNIIIITKFPLNNNRSTSYENYFES